MPERTLRRARGSRRWTALLAVTGALLGAALVAAPAAYAAPATTGALTIGTDATATAGDTLTVTIAAETTADLFAYDLVVSFDPALLAFDAGSLITPDGGFAAASTEAGTVSLTHTRLGTSPGLAGQQVLASVTFTTLAAGDARIAVTGGTLIGTEGESTPIDTTGLEAITTIAAAPVVPGPTEPSPGTGTDPGAALPVTDTTPTDPLAVTGADATGWLVTGAVAAALVALGVVLVIRRRAATR
ncbi:cohesin domain-containing protein [Microbacterium sp. NPDC089189]|uniref:cohesin domain-containing protein n=1 Tax=Microbacterium sp. NPDC089189 TaxID=3154972 RepID=UPI0034216A67